MYCLILFIVLQAISISLSIDSKEKDENKLSDDNSVSLLLQQLEIPEYEASNSIMREITNEGKLDQLQEYVEHIKKRGTKVINQTNRLIINMKQNKNISQDVDLLTNDYETKIENYVTTNYMPLLKSQYLVDSVYMYLDILNTAYRSLFRVHRQYFEILVREAKVINKTTTDDNVRRVRGVIFNENHNFQKHELLYICNNYQICRPFSAFSDQFYNFVTEILALPDHNFKRVVDLLYLVISNDEQFIKLIAASENILRNMDDLFLKPAIVKECLEVLRALLVHRYKIINIPNLERRKKVQATRALLDAIDKALYFSNDTQIFLNMQTAIAAINKTTSGVLLYGEEEDVNEDLGEFIYSIFEALSRSREYFVPCLIDTIVTGNIVKEKAYKDLFCNGSNNVYSTEELSPHNQ